MACIEYKGKIYTKTEFEQFLKDNNLKDTIAKIEGKRVRPKKIGRYEVTESKINRINDAIIKGLPVAANDTADLYLINKMIFGLDDTQAEAAAIIADRMMRSMATAKGEELAQQELEATQNGNLELAADLRDQRLAINPYQNVFYTKNMGAPNSNIDSQIGQPQSEPHGAVQLFNNQKALIYAISNPNVTTPLHELAHVWEQYLTAEEKEVLEKFAGSKDKITVSETFARGFEKYLADGESSNKELKPLFEKFKNWIKNIYYNLKGSPIDIELNEDMKKIYAKMLGVKNPTLKDTNKSIKIENGQAQKTEVAQQSTTAVLDANSIRDLSDDDFLELFADKNEIDEKSPQVFFQKDNSEKPSVAETMKNATALEKWLKAQLLAGKIDARKSKNAATTVFDALGGNPEKIKSLLGLDPNLSNDKVKEELAKFIEATWNKGTRAKTAKWVDGLPREDSQRQTKNMTIEKAAKIARRDNEFDKLKKLIEEGKVQNSGSSADVTAAILFATESRRRYFNQRGITQSELHEFLMSNKLGNDVDFRAVKENYKKAFQTEGTKEVDFLGGKRIINGQVQPYDVHAVAARYLFDESIDEETKAFILEGTPPRTSQPREIVEAFVGRILSSTKKAAEEAADKKYGGRATKAQKATAYKEALIEMAKMDRILAMMSNVVVNNRNAVETMSLLGDNDNNAQVADELIKDGTPHGFELLLLTHIASELRGLGTPQDVANVVNVQSRLATQYGRAISYLQAVDGVTYSGKSLFLKLKRQEIEVKNKQRESQKADFNSDTTIGETLDNIAEKAINITEESKEEFAQKADTKAKEVANKIRRESTLKKSSDYIKRVAKNIKDRLTNEEKEQLIQEIKRYDTDADVKMQDATPVNITDKLMSMALEEVIKERLEKGYSTDFDDASVQNAIYNRYNDLMDEVANLLEDGVLTKQGAQKFRKKFGAVKGYSGIATTDFKTPFDEAFANNRTKLEQQVEELRDQARGQLVDSIVKSGTKNKAVSTSTKKSKIKSLIEKGKKSRANIDEERKKQIAQKDSKVQAALETAMLDIGELLHNTVAQANELGINLDATELANAPYSVFNAKNIRALAKELTKKGLGKSSMVDYLTEYMVSTIDTLENLLLQDPIHQENPNNVRNVAKVIELMTDAAIDSITVYELEFLAQREAQLEAEEEKLNKLIAQEQKKEENKARKAALKIQREIINELKEKESFVERANNKAKAIEAKANQTSADKLGELIESTKPDTEKVLMDFVTTVTDNQIKDLLESDFENISTDDFAEITRYVADNVPKGEKRNTITNELLKKFRESRGRNAAKSGLSALKSKIDNSKKDKEDADKKVADLQASIVEAIMNNNLAFITPYHIALVRDFIKNNITDEQEKAALEALIEDIENNIYDATKAQVIDEFAEILANITRLKSGNTSKTADVTTREKLASDVAKKEEDIAALMEAREAFRTAGHSGEKLAILDDMLSQLLGRTIGQSDVRSVIKEFLETENAESIENGKKTIATILKEFYNNEDNREKYRSSLQDFIRESLGITDSKVIEEVIKAFNETYDSVWDNAKRRRLEQEVNDVLRANLNKADEEVRRAQQAYDNDKTKENKRALDKAKSNQKAAKRNYERILRNAPRLDSLVEAIRNGMPNNDEFRQLFYRAYGLTPFTTADAKEFENAANMISSKDAETERKGYVKMRDLMRKYTQQGSFMSMFDPDSMFKKNMLSGIGSFISASFGGLLTKKKDLVGLIWSVIQNDIMDNITLAFDKSKGIETKREINFKVTQAIGKAIIEMVGGFLNAIKKTAQIIIRGETDSNTISDLEGMLIHADKTIADYVMTGYALSPMLWADIVTRPDMTISEIIQKLGMSPDQRIAFVEMLKNNEAEIRAMFEEMQGVAIQTTIEELINNYGASTKTKAILAMRGFSFKNKDNLKKLTDSLRTDLEQKGVILGSFTGGAKVGWEVLKEAGALFVRVSAYATELGSRLLSSADIMMNTLFGNSTRVVTATVEALKIFKDYERKKEGFSRIKKELDENITNGITPDEAYFFLINQKEMSDIDKGVLRSILDDQTTDDAEKLFNFSSYVNGENHPENLRQKIWREFTDEDKRIIGHLLKGEDIFGNPIMVTEKDGTTRPLNGNEIVTNLESYLNGSISDNGQLRTWKETLLDSNLYKATTPVGRVMERTQKVEESFNAELGHSVAISMGESNMNTDVSGRLGYWQRKYASNIIGRASNRIKKRRLIKGDTAAFFSLDFLKDFAQIAIINATFPLSRLIAGGAKWMQSLLPTSLIQARLMDVSEAQDGSFMTYYSPDPMEYFSRFGFYFPYQWRSNSYFDRVMEFSEVNNRWQWRAERRMVTAEKKYKRKLPMKDANGNDMYEERVGKVVESRELPTFQKISNKAIITYANLSVAYLWYQMGKDSMFCISKDGQHKLIRPHADCECSTGDCNKKPSMIVTGSVFDKQGDKFKPNSVYVLYKTPKKNEKGEIIYYNGEPIYDYDYKWEGYWNLDPINSYKYSGWAAEYDRVLKAQQEGVGLDIMKPLTRDPLERGIDGLTGILSRVYNSSGLLNQSESLLKFVDNVVKMAKGAGEVDERKAAESAQATNTLLSPLFYYTPFSSAMNKDMNKWFGERIMEYTLADKLRNSSYTIGQAMNLIDGERMHEITPQGTTKEATYKYDIMKMNELRTEQEKKVDYIVNGMTHLANSAFYNPRIYGVAKAFEQKVGETPINDYFKVSHFTLQGIPTAALDDMNKRAASYKIAYLTDENMYKVKGSQEKMSIAEAMEGYNDHVKMEVMRDINTYANNRAQFEFLFDQIYDSGMVTEVKKGSYIKEPLPEDRQKAKDMFLRKEGEGLYSTNMVLPESIKRIGIEYEVPSGSDYPEYPEYTISSLAKWMAENGVAYVNGKVVYRADINQTKLTTRK